jgi:hypothetical protein
MEPIPANRSTLRRRPDGSAKTGLDSTGERPTARRIPVIPVETPEIDIDQLAGAVRCGGR